MIETRRYGVFAAYCRSPALCPCEVPPVDPWVVQALKNENVALLASPPLSKTDQPEKKKAGPGEAPAFKSNAVNGRHAW